MLFEIYFRMKNEYLTVNDSAYYTDWILFLFEYVTFNRDRIISSMVSELDYSRRTEEYIKWLDKNYSTDKDYFTEFDEFNLANYMSFLMEVQSERYETLNPIKKVLQCCFGEKEFNSINELL